MSDQAKPPDWQPVQRPGNAHQGSAVNPYLIALVVIIGLLVVGWAMRKNLAASGGAEREADALQDQRLREQQGRGGG
jgi:hypothetical protein